MNYLKTILAFLLLLFPFLTHSQEISPLPQTVEINLNNLKSSLTNTAVFYSDEATPDIQLSGSFVTFIGIDGTNKDFRIIETPVLSKEYSKDHPEFKSYTGVSIDGKTQVKLSITPAGLTGVLIERGKFYYIEKSKTGLLNTYDLFDQSQIKGDASCGFNDPLEGVDSKGLRSVKGVANTNGSQRRNFRIAIACTGEFTARNGGTVAGANARINDLLTLINARYETELATTFTLVASNDSIVYLDPATDPFSPSGGASASQSQSAFNGMNTSGVMPYGNYDIGQTLHYRDIPTLPNGSISASGQAGPTPCNDGSKSSSWTQYSEGAGATASAAFITGIIIHEMGHQFSAWHTFNGSGSNCAPGTGQYDATAAYEPGSGNTIMSYNGICGTAYNLTGGKVDYFHARSLFQISTSLNGSAGSCITPTSNTNNVPSANAGADFTIPKETPFTLTGTGSDTDGGDVLTYTWDQYDQPVNNDQGALGTLAGVGGYNAINSTTAPLFRTKQSNDGIRTFPDLSFILNNTNTPPNNEGEALSAVARDIDMRLVVRDNKVIGGAYDTDDVKITVADSGPFRISSQNTSTLWFQGTTQNITWDVNNTDQAPVNCTNVKISLSDDGGMTFNTVIAASTPNDGSYTYTVPNNPSTQVRIKIEAVGNIFFDINDVDITISDGACTPEVSQIIDASPVSFSQGSASLNLDLSSSGAAISTFSESITSSDPGSNLSFDLNGSCSGPSNSNRYDSYKFLVSNSGTYSFSFSGAFALIMNLYQNGYSPTNVCNDWIASTGSSTGGSVSLSNSLSASLTPGVYEIVMSSFSNSQPSLPAPYTITSSTGTIYSLVPSDGSSYSYTYLVYNTSSGLITAFDPTTDLSNTDAGSYRIYGLSYAGGFNLTPYLNTSFSSFQTALGNGSICGLLSSNFKDVTITCGSLPSPPTVNSPTIPYNTAANLTASGCAGTVNWFDMASGGTQQLTGASVSTPNLLATTSYYAECNLGGCVSSSRSEAVITVLPSPCANTLTLASPTDDISSGTSTFQSNNNTAASNPGLISATNQITGGNTTYDAGKKVELNPGFQASNGAVFTAKIGGCSN